MPDPRSMHPRARRQLVELLLGLIGFFVVMSVVNAVGRIALGEPSILASVVLAVLGTAWWLLWRSYRRLP